MKNNLLGKALLLSSFMAFPAYALKDKPEDWNPYVKAHVIDRMTRGDVDVNDIIKTDWQAEAEVFKGVSDFKNWKKSIGPMSKENEFVDANLLRTAGKDDILAGLLADTEQKKSGSNTAKTIQLLIHLAGQKAKNYFDQAYFAKAADKKHKKDLEDRVFESLWTQFGLATAKGDLSDKDSVHKIHCFQLGILGYVEKNKKAAVNEKELFDHLSGYLTGKGVTSVMVKNGGKKDVSAFVKHCHDLISKHSPAIMKDYTFEKVDISQKFLKDSYGLTEFGPWNDNYKETFKSAKETWSNNLTQMQSVWDTLTSISKLDAYKNKVDFMPAGFKEELFDGTKWDLKTLRADEIASFLQSLYSKNLFSALSNKQTVKPFVDALTAILLDMKDVKDAVMKNPTFQVLEDQLKGQNKEGLLNQCADLEKSERVLLIVKELEEIFRTAAYKGLTKPGTKSKAGNYDIFKLTLFINDIYSNLKENPLDLAHINKLLKLIAFKYIDDSEFFHVNELSNHVEFFEKTEQEIFNQYIDLLSIFSKPDEVIKAQTEGQNKIDARKGLYKKIKDVQKIHTDIETALEKIKTIQGFILAGEDFKGNNINQTVHKLKNYLSNLMKYRGDDLEYKNLIDLKEIFDQDAFKELPIDGKYEENIKTAKEIEDTIVTAFSSLKDYGLPHKDILDAKQIEGFQKKREANIEKVAEEYKKIEEEKKKKAEELQQKITNVKSTHDSFIAELDKVEETGNNDIKGHIKAMKEGFKVLAGYKGEAVDPKTIQDLKQSFLVKDRFHDIKVDNDYTKNVAVIKKLEDALLKAINDLNTFKVTNISVDGVNTAEFQKKREEKIQAIIQAKEISNPVLEVLNEYKDDNNLGQTVLRLKAYTGKVEYSGGHFLAKEAGFKADLKRVLTTGSSDSVKSIKENFENFRSAGSLELCRIEEILNAITIDATQHGNIYPSWFIKNLSDAGDEKIVKDQIKKVRNAIVDFLQSDVIKAKCREALKADIEKLTKS